MGSTACTEPQCLYKGALYLYLMEINIKASDVWCVTPCCPLEIYYEEGGWIFLRKVCKFHSTP